MPEVGELPVAVWTGLGLAAWALGWRGLGAQASVRGSRGKGGGAGGLQQRHAADVVIDNF